jgi:hypothetical protein
MLGIHKWSWVLLAASAIILVVAYWERLVTAADGHEGLAAWVQAAGTIAALAVAVWLSNSQSNRTRDDAQKARFDRTRTLSFRLLPIVQDIASGIERVKKSAEIFDYGKTVIKFPSIIPGERTPPADASDAIRQMTVDVTWRDNIYDHFDALPAEWAQKAADLFYLTYTYDRTITNLLNHAARNGLDKIADINKYVDPSLNEIYGLTTELETQLNLMRVA